MGIENNSLERYLINEIEKIKKDIENKKNRHYVNQKIINECLERIREYRDKEDSVFNLLSPISVESSYKEEIALENQTIEQANEENLVLVSEIDECNEKISEISRQLEAQNNGSHREEGVMPDPEPDTSESTAHEENSAETAVSDIDWSLVLNRSISELQEIEASFYSDPQSCRKKISDLKEYLEGISELS